MQGCRHVSGRIWAFVLVAAVTSSCGEDPAIGLRLAVQRYDPVGACWQTLWTELEPAIDVGPVCSAAPSSPTFVAGADRARVIVDYGDELEFTPGTTVPKPSISVSVAGQEVNVNPDTQARSGDRAVFDSSFAIPANPVGLMSVRAKASEGLERDAGTSFQVVAPTIAARYDDCSSDVVCERYGGVDSVVLELTAPGSAAQAATLTWTLAGVPSSQTVTLDQPSMTESGPGVEKTIAIPVPPAPDGTVWALSARLGTERVDLPAVVIRAAPIVLTVDGCVDGTPCEKTANTGLVTLRPIVLGKPGQTVTLSSTLDGILQPGTRSLVLSTSTMYLGREAATGADFVGVAVAPEGARWQWSAVLGSSRGTSPELILRSPIIGSALTCGALCDLSAGKTVSVRVSAPADSLTKQALLTTTVNGVVELSAATLNLTSFDQSSQTVSGTQNLPVPASPGATWSIDASVGGYAASTIVVQIAP